VTSAAAVCSAIENVNTMLASFVHGGPGQLGDVQSARACCCVPEEVLWPSGLWSFGLLAKVGEQLGDFLADSLAESLHALDVRPDACHESVHDRRKTVVCWSVDRSPDERRLGGNFGDARDELRNRLTDSGGVD
jgi:hypothetical protein